MYQVTVIVSPSDPNNSISKYKRISHTGIFMPKGKRCKTDRIKKQVTDQILATYKEQRPDLNYKTSVTIKRIGNDFFFKES